MQDTATFFHAIIFNGAESSGALNKNDKITGYFFSFLENNSKNDFWTAVRFKIDVSVRNEKNYTISSTLLYDSLF